VRFNQGDRLLVLPKKFSWVDVGQFNAELVQIRKN
jgi:mannose-1-phosphate guanylyltransferase